jgi:NitT/TauT family transport system substrate-binding protein
MKLFRGVACILQAAAVVIAAALTTPAPAAETVTFISVGSSSANFWPSAVAMEKGFFTAAGITPDIVFAQANANVIQQVTAGSAHVSTNSGLVDPVRAIEKGAPLALIRLEV